MSQHRPNATSIPAVVLAPLGTTLTRHAAPSRARRPKVTVAAAAVAMGAVVATGFQVTSPVSAAADPVVDAHDAALKAARDAAPTLSPEVNGAIDGVEHAYQDYMKQFAPPPPPRPAVVRPVAGPVSSGFGSRWGTKHNGVDFADPIGTPIHSVSSGTVIEAGPASGFGLWVRVKQDDDTTAVYGHVNEIRSQVGQRVDAGDVIATVGNRGQSTGPHLHLEIWDAAGRKTDPAPYLAEHGVAVPYGPDH
ncbi:M23 family metallopeptidase [Aldersonia sp. NBC_00410]|uniref:M23 family metallopeptidase n=1 Tax=Aldersonia sp. NBC_00410 TaxID=2975954 RepID=UPI002251C862|nr:M23 family metallopeptidase [Aldersonia sp. NBC_00410]MCX5045627.1 M23 family metallopeptidase [Aldersonia sp. NBC_00410]